MPRTGSSTFLIFCNKKPMHVVIGTRTFASNVMVKMRSEDKRSKGATSRVRDTEAYANTWRWEVYPIDCTIQPLKGE
jgi:hypothetical protein